MTAEQQDNLEAVLFAIIIFIGFIVGLIMGISLC